VPNVKLETCVFGDLLPARRHRQRVVDLLDVGVENAERTVDLPAGVTCACSSSSPPVNSTFFRLSMTCAPPAAKST
jgi:hypothetical protein